MLRTGNQHRAHSIVCAGPPQTKTLDGRQMDDPTSAKLAAVRTEEFENLRAIGSRSDELTTRDEEALWKEADLRARKRLGRPSYSQVKWGERYYDTSGMFPEWRIKERPNYLLGLAVVIFIVVGLWLA